MPVSNPNKEPDDSQTWELVERCLLPIAFSHAAAVILATILNTLCISQTSSFGLFIILLGLSVGSTLFYHNLKVSFNDRILQERSAIDFENLLHN